MKSISSTSSNHNDKDSDNSSSSDDSNNHFDIMESHLSKKINQKRNNVKTLDNSMVNKSL